MIEGKAFRTGMLALCETFGRKATPELCRIYEAVLGPRLSTEEWAYAWESALLEERFWPVPAVLLATVLRRREVLTAEPEAWQLEGIDRQARRLAERATVTHGVRVNAVPPGPDPRQVESATRQREAKAAGVAYVSDSAREIRARLEAEKLEVRP